MNILIIAHYSEDDVAFESDYCKITIKICGIEAQTYGNCQDRGFERAQAFSDGIKTVMLETSVSYQQVNDFKVDEPTPAR